jgi:hypothetical protein
MVPGHAEHGETMLTVAEAKRILETVSESTLYNWIDEGRLECEMRDGQKLVSVSSLRRTPLLQRADVLARSNVKALKVTEGDLTNAFADGALHPSDAPDRRYSLNDVDALVAWKSGTWKSGVESQILAIGRAGNSTATSTSVAGALRPKNPMSIEPDPFLVHAGRWKALVDYIANHGDPMRLPATFWDTRTCPEFIPPTGVFRFTYWLPFGIQEYGVLVATVPVGIRRSAGWVIIADGEDGRPELRQEPEDDRFDAEDEFMWPPGKEVPRYGAFNLQWHSLRESWQQAWHLRGCQRRAAGTDVRTLPAAEAPQRRDRRALLRRYHEESWAPSDLPDWFFDGEECPSFEPPNDTCLFEYGEACENPSTGELGTWIRATGSYSWVLGTNAVTFRPGAEHEEWVPGVFTEGTIPAKYQAEAHQYRAAEEEWLEEWRRRARFRRGED